MRDILIHQYFGVNLAVIWETVIRDIPEILPIFQQMQIDKQVEGE